MKDRIFDSSIKFYKQKNKENGDLIAFGDNSRYQCETKNTESQGITKLFNEKSIKSIVLGYFLSFYIKRKQNKN